MELYRPTPLRHVFDVLAPKDVPKLRAHDQRKTLPVVPVATDAANEEGHDVHVVRRIQGEGGHERGLAADHTGFQGVPGVLGASYERFQLLYFLLSILQEVWCEIADYLNMVINNVICLRGPRRTVQETLNSGTDLIDLFKKRGQCLLLSEAVGYTPAGHFEHPIESLLRRFIRQTAAHVCATQAKKSPAQLFPVVSRL